MFITHAYIIHTQSHIIWTVHNIHPYTYTYVPSNTHILLVSRSQTTFFLLYWGGKKGSGTLPIETAVLASTLVGVSVECNFLDVLNAIDRDAASCESR